MVFLVVACATIWLSEQAEEEEAAAFQALEAARSTPSSERTDPQQQHPESDAAMESHEDEAAPSAESRTRRVRRRTQCRRSVREPAE
jgi:hypothetical protein